MTQSFIVGGKDLNFKVGSVRCISGQAVNLNPDDYLVCVHISQGDLINPVTTPKATKKEKSNVQS
jgi:hypothetical protein